MGPDRGQNRVFLHGCGADEGIRTPDLRITNALLYRLSYIGVTNRLFYTKSPRG